MELHQLRAFTAVARTGHLARASDYLHLTQSAVSKQLKVLEEELGTLLFERVPAGMVLTCAGRQLLPLAQQALDAVQQLGAAAASLRGVVAGPLRLGTIIDPESLKLGPLLASLLNFYPHVDVSQNHGISGTVLERLRADEVDACFFLGVITDPDIVVQQLMMEHYVVVGPVAWKDRLEQADWQAIAAMPWMSTPVGSSQHRLVTQMFSERGFVHKPIVQADQEASMVELVQTGVALGLMRERLATHVIAQGSAAVWRGVRVPCPLSLLWRRSRADSAVLRALAASVQLVWRLDADGTEGGLATKSHPAGDPLT